MTHLRIGFGDWFFVELLQGTTVVANVPFATEADAKRASDALWSLHALSGAPPNSEPSTP